MNQNGQKQLEEVNSENSHPLQKMRSRLLSEDYKYRMLKEGRQTSDDDDGAKRSSRITYMLCLLGLLFVLTIALVGIIIWQYASTKPQPCLTQQCVENSAYILNRMNTSADPCDDFYEYACGRWTDRIIPPDKAKYGTFQVLGQKTTAFVKMVLDGSKSSEKPSQTLQNARDYYNMCLDTETIEMRGNTPLLKLIKKLGSWPLTSDSLSGTWKSETWDFVESLAVHHNNSGSAFFVISVSADDRNSSVNRITVEQAGLTLASYEEYSKPNVKDYHDAFMAFAVEYLQLLGVDNNTAVSMMESVWDLELQMAKAYVPKEELIKVEKTYHKMTVKEFQSLLASSIDFKSYLDKLFYRSIPEDEEIIVYTPSYFKKLTTILKATPKDVIATYIVWSYVNEITGYLPSKYVDASMILTKIEDGVSVVSPLWQRCTRKAESAFGFALGAEYVKAKFSKQQKSQVEGIFDDIRNAFISNIPGLDWMDSETKEVAIDKAKVEGIFDDIRNAFISNIPGLDWMDSKTKEVAIDKAKAVVKTIGYPDWILDDKKVEEYFSGIVITEGGFFESHQSYLHWRKQRKLKRLGNPPDRTEWSMIPTDINAYYTSSYNKIVVPAAILQRPFFDSEFPWSFNLGSMGMVMGHELTHGFDNKGGKFDKFGNMHRWWGDESTKQFSKKKECMEKQYSEYTVQGEHVNGIYTASENIADNGGVRTAYTAFQKWKKENEKSAVLPGLGLNDEQLFFLGYSQVWCSYYTPAYAKHAILSDPHSPSKYRFCNLQILTNFPLFGQSNIRILTLSERVIGVMSNMPEFSRAYNCPKNSPMTSSKPCRVW